MLQGRGVGSMIVRPTLCCMFKGLECMAGAVAPDHPPHDVLVVEPLLAGCVQDPVVVCVVVALHEAAPPQQLRCELPRITQSGSHDSEALERADSGIRQSAVRLQALDQHVQPAPL